MTDLTKHAEAILRAADVRNHELMLRPYTREAILAALDAFHTEAFEAGAVAMREEAASVADHRCDDGEDDACCEDTSFCIASDIRAIDPTTLKGRGA